MKIMEVIKKGGRHFWKEKESFGIFPSRNNPLAFKLLAKMPYIPSGNSHIIVFDQEETDKLRMLGAYLYHNDAEIKFLDQTVCRFINQRSSRQIKCSYLEEGQAALNGGKQTKTTKLCLIIAG